MIPTSFQRNLALELLAHEFPDVIGLEVDHFNPRMTPIEYDDGRRQRQEVPPTFRWKVGNRAFSFAPRPSFVQRVQRGIWPLIADRVVTEPVYGDEQLEALRGALAQSVEPKDTP